MSAAAQGCLLSNSRGVWVLRPEGLYSSCCQLDKVMCVSLHQYFRVSDSWADHNAKNAALGLDLGSPEAYK
jgi:hypothetical protein